MRKVLVYIGVSALIMVPLSGFLVLRFLEYDWRAYQTYEEYQRPGTHEAYIVFHSMGSWSDDIHSRLSVGLIRRSDGSLAPTRHRILPYGGKNERWSQDGTLLVFKTTEDVTPYSSGYPRTFKSWYRFAYDFRKHQEIAPNVPDSRRSAVIARLVKDRGGLGAVAIPKNGEISLAEQNKYSDLWEKASQVQVEE